MRRASMGTADSAKPIVPNAAPARVPTVAPRMLALAADGDGSVHDLSVGANGACQLVCGDDGLPQRDWQEHHRASGLVEEESGT